MPNYDEKEIIFLEKMDSDIFEKAIFILKPKAKKNKLKNRKDFVKEAERIVQHYMYNENIGLSYPYDSKKKSGRKSNQKTGKIIDMTLNISLFLASLLFLYYVSKVFL